MASSSAPLFQAFPMLAGRAAQAWRHQPAFHRPRHFHAEPELNLVVRGHARIGVGERTFLLTAGMLLAFQPGQDHELIEASPDLDPAHEALLLREHFVELLRTEAVQQQPERFRELLDESEKAAADLETALREWKADSSTVPERITRSFASISQNCTACHHEFRDIPLGEKQR